MEIGFRNSTIANEILTKHTTMGTIKIFGMNCIVQQKKRERWLAVSTIYATDLEPGRWDPLKGERRSNNHRQRWELTWPTVLLISNNMSICFHRELRTEIKNVSNMR